ncbi:MAG: hypothetical protein ACLFSZ_09730 [Puniceicoccaceae bacterium]
MPGRRWNTPAVAVAAVLFLGVGLAAGWWTGREGGPPSAPGVRSGESQELARALAAEERARRKAEAELASMRRTLDSLLRQVREAEDADAATGPGAEQTATLAGFEFTAEGFQEALRLRRDELGHEVPLAEFLSRLSPEEAWRAMDELRTGPQDPYRRQLAERFVRAWAQTDPSAVLAYAEEVGRWDLKQQAIQNGVRHLAKTDPAGAIGWLDERQGQLSDHLYRRNLLLAMSGYADTDPHGALDYVEGIGSERIWGQPLRRIAYQHVFAEMAVDGRLAEGRAHLDLLPEGEARAQARLAFLRALTNEEPVEAFEFAGDPNMERMVLRDWAGRDPKAAAAFVETLPPEHPRLDLMLADVVRQYAHYDIDAPAEWLNQFPPSPQTDHAVAAYALSSMSRDAAGAMTWAASITESTARARTVEQVARAWRNQDSRGLEAFLREDATLTAQQKHQLLPQVFPAAP